MSMKIGFIGLGNMGAPMATNLAKAGHDVAGFDVAGTTAEGVRVADSLEAAVAGMDAVITMLPNGSILRQVAAQAIPHMAQGTLFIDCSTVDVESAKNTAQAAEDAGIMAVDAPVSGGIGGASSGTLKGQAPVRHHGAKGGALRRCRCGASGEDLQQHDPRGHHDRHLRGLCAGR